MALVGAAAAASTDMAAVASARPPSQPAPLSPPSPYLVVGLRQQRSASWHSAGVRLRRRGPSARSRLQRQKRRANKIQETLLSSEGWSAASEPQKHKVWPLPWPEGESGCRPGGPSTRHPHSMPSRSNMIKRNTRGAVQSAKPTLGLIVPGIPKSVLYSRTAVVSPWYARPWLQGAPIRTERTGAPRRGRCHSSGSSPSADPQWGRLGHQRSLAVYLMAVLAGMAAEVYE